MHFIFVGGGSSQEGNRGSVLILEVGEVVRASSLCGWWGGVGSWCTCHVSWRGLAVVIYVKTSIPIWRGIFQKIMVKSSNIC